MADEKNPKPGLFAQTLAKAVDLWRILVGLLVSFREQTRAFIEWLADEKPGEKSPWLTAARWDEIKDIAAGLPALMLQLCIVAGMVWNLCRAQVEATPTADPLDGAALVSSELPQLTGFYWLAALMLILTVGRGFARDIAKAIVAIKKAAA